MGEIHRKLQKAVMGVSGQRGDSISPTTLKPKLTAQLETCRIKGSFLCTRENKATGKAMLVVFGGENKACRCRESEYWSYNKIDRRASRTRLRVSSARAG